MQAGNAKKLAVEDALSGWCAGACILLEDTMSLDCLCGQKLFSDCWENIMAAGIWGVKEHVKICEVSYIEKIKE